MNSPVRFFGNTKARPAGEAWVWFTGMGLCLGLAMVVYLLGLITVKGLEVFWPRRVVLVSLTGAPSEDLGASGQLAGVITREQEKMARVVESPAETEPVPPRELQLFLGNKDAYGLSFKYLDETAVVSRQYPKTIFRMERLEYGDAVGFPVRLEYGDGPAIPAEAADFETKLRSEVLEVAARWKRIKHLEKKKIGRINLEMEKIRIREKIMKKRDTDISRLAARRDRLQKDYEALASESAGLRRLQQANQIAYRLASGQERRIPTGNIVDFYYPNRLGFTDRLGIFFHKIRIFLMEEPREANTEGGVFPAIFGTFVMTVMMSIAVTPFGVLAAIYLREYARQGFMVRSVRIAVNNLAGVPSIVFGVFGLGFFVYFVGGTIDQLFFHDSLPTPTFGTGGILWAALTLALLTVPVVIVATEEALAAVPRGMREGSLACGASKWQTIKNIVLPAAAPGILTGLILAMARGASEVAPLMLVGVVKLAPNLPLDGIFPFVHLERKFMHLGFHIYDLGFQSPDSEAAKPMVFATTLLLIGLVVLLNLGAIMIRQRIRKKYFVGAF